MVNTLATAPSHTHATAVADGLDSQRLFANAAAGPTTASEDVTTFGITLPAPHISNLLPAPVTQNFIPSLNKPNVFSPQSDLSSGTQLNTAVLEGTSTSEGTRQGNQSSQWRRLSPNSNRLPRPSERYYTSLRSPELEIEDVTDWSTVTFFTSLYLKYNHALSPIVHKPTFAHDLATRRDKTDRQFRSLLLGLGEYSGCAL